MIWQSWKKGFDAWENATAKYLEHVLKSPALLMPSGLMLGGAMKAKSAYDRMASQWMGSMGLATKRDQERALHTLNQIESRLLDLEERLEDALAKNKNGAA